MEIMRRAAVERAQTGRPAVRYVVVLTKVDKASAKQLAATRRDVARACRQLLETLPAPSPTAEPAGGDSTSRDHSSGRQLLETLPAPSPTAEPAGGSISRDHSSGGSSGNNGSSGSIDSSCNSNNVNEVTIVETSAITRTGRDHMWKLILKLLAESP